MHRHKPGSIVKLDRYRHERTDGAIGGLFQLIRGATSEAVMSGSKAITRKTPEAIKLVSLGPVQGEMLGSHLRRLAIVEQPSRIRTRRAHRTLAIRVLAAQQHHGPLNGTAPSGPVLTGKLPERLAKALPALPNLADFLNLAPVSVVSASSAAAVGPAGSEAARKHRS